MDSQAQSQHARSVGDRMRFAAQIAEVVIAHSLDLQAYSSGRNLRRIDGLCMRRIRIEVANAAVRCAAAALAILIMCTQIATLQNLSYRSSFRHCQLQLFVCRVGCATSRSRSGHSFWSWSSQPPTISSCIPRSHLLFGCLEQVLYFGYDRFTGRGTLSQGGGQRSLTARIQFA
jgi:hypothetical protein